MRSFFFNRQIDRIEREGNNELLLVRELGAHHFSTPELYTLLERLREQREVVSRKLNRLYRIGLATPGFFLATFLASYFQVTWLTLAFFTAVPIVLLAYTVQSIRIRRDHPTYYDSEVIEEAIRQELHRREGSSIF